MSTQPSLFADYPRARNTDSESSHIAAHEVKSSGRLAVQQHIALETVRYYPGRTSSELAQLHAHATGQNEYKVREWLHKRLSELEPLQIFKGEPRICTVTRRTACTWYPVTTGAMAA